MGVETMRRPSQERNRLSDSAFDLHKKLLKTRNSIDIQASAETVRPTENGSAEPDTYQQQKSAERPYEAPLSPEDPDYKLHETTNEIDPKDEPTPDKWVPRHRAIVRLTGRHPLNCEPPLSMLMERGFITPSALHYVRSHGPVPKLDWATHTITVGGNLKRPQTFTMSELVDTFESVTFPVTLTCAGNRRKEQNLVKKSVGFNWGASGLSNSYWTGVRLCDVLRHCGIGKPRDGAKYVCFRGVQKELPQGKDGSYGTSLCWQTAMDESCDVILAYKQNDRYLLPDHGAPVRIIIPGHIGGRMVKWLEEITVSDKESDNFYHFHDNRVLPPGIEQEQAKADGWWYRPEFIINELNVNSVITTPAHDALIPISGAPTYTIRGYAYSGGGRAVIRVEVSLDECATWRRTNIERFVEPNEYGKTWTWVHWHLEVPTVDLVHCREMRCRAVDSSNNLQPDKLTWNLMGMMNNPHFRVKMQPRSGPNGELNLACEHPTKQGSEPGGWMEREVAGVREAEAKALAAELEKKNAVDESKLRMYSLEEIEQHDSHSSSWFVHGGRVYDATAFLKDHPGGAESILIVAGQDATDEFNAIHSAKAKAMLNDYLIGKVAPAGSIAPAMQRPAAVEVAVEGQELIALNPKKKIPFKLIDKIQLSHNSRLFRFALQSPKHKLGLPVGQHMFFYCKDKGEMVMRAYTPTSSDDDLGHFDLVVKIYFANQHPQFPMGGRMSVYLENMKINDTIDVKGPLGHFIYYGKGKYKNHGREGKCTEMSMMAGGTGITPMYQVIQAVIKDKSDPTRIKMIFANQTEDDILLGDDLNDFEEDPRVTIHYLLSRPKSKENWTGSVGRCSEDLLRKHCFADNGENLAMLCGPPGMIDQACKPALAKMGYTEERIVVF